MTTMENFPLLPLNHSLIPPIESNSITIEVHKPKASKRSQFLNDINEVANSRTFASKPSFFKWLTFSSMFSYVKKINQAPESFTLQDVPNIQSQFNIESKLLQLDKHWQEELTHSQNPSFWRALQTTFSWEILQTVFLVLIESTAKLYFSIYMGKIINTISSSASPQLISSAVIISLLVIISTFAKGWYYFLIATNIAKARLTITALLYKKLNSTSLTSVHEISIGKVLNLVGNDLNDMINLFTVPTMLLMPYMIVLGTSMLWGYFGVSCLIGVGYIVLVLFIQIYLSNIANDVNKENKKITDERVRLTHETFESIRLIKMYTWDKLFQHKVHQLRENEHKGFVKISSIDALGFNLSSMSVYINIFIISMIYTLSGGILSPEKVYASIMILMFLSSALVASHSGRMGLKNCKNIAKRTQEVLLIQDIDNELQQENTHKSEVLFEDFCGYWNASSKPCLSNINLTIRPGVLTSVIGKIGSGKSSLLMSFLREIPHTTGSLSYSGRIAYVEQDPVIFSGTIRQNILFGREYNPALYKKILTACCLDKDLESLAYGDLTYIGEKGVNMSGGQKARVSLARAFYSQSDIYLLDDPFSALDSRVSRVIFNNALKGDLLRTKTVILVTHHLNFARESDHIVLMNDGEIEAQGKFSDIEKLNISLLSSSKQSDHQANSSQDKEFNETEVPEEKKQTNEKFTEEKETKEEGVKVTLQTYKQYFSTEKAGQKLVIIALLFIGSQAGILYYARFIGYWAEAHTNSPSTEFLHSPYIIKSVIILALTSLLSYFKVTKLLEFIYEIDTELHRKMFNALLKAQTLFFDLNPTGRILNRFSNDLGVLDKVNPKRTLEMLENGVSYIGVLITICFINPAIIIPAVLVILGLYNLKNFFEKSVEVVRTLELQSKSPMLTAVSSTINGLKIIRAYNQGGRFVRDFMDLLFHNIKSFIFMEQIIRLFSFLLEAPIQFLTISGIWMFIALITYYNFQPGLLGLCLLYLLKIGDQGGMVVRQIIYLNMNMQSAQRMLDYSKTPNEAPAEIPRKDFKVVSQNGGKWPNKGEIVFDNVYLRYKKSLDFALKGLSLRIPAGLKVACIGRTGAGKSSIVQALFRMVEIEGYSSIEIDGVDISEIGLNLLRSSLSIIPQTPVIFADTIRKNLDPTERLTDQELWRVLEEVGLKEHVERLEKGLDTDMKNSATVFSNGQKQLVCLGRAIINKSKIIILDEATANIDVETDAFIQKTIMEKFKDCTVLTIAHRLITIADYDRVVVIDEGRVVEFDTPYNLLVKKTEEKNVFAEMVKSTGAGMANRIFIVAKNQHEKSRANKGF